MTKIVKDVTKLGTEFRCMDNPLSGDMTQKFTLTPMKCKRHGYKILVVNLTNTKDSSVRCYPKSDVGKCARTYSDRTPISERPQHLFDATTKHIVDKSNDKLVGGIITMTNNCGKPMYISTMYGIHVAKHSDADYRTSYSNGNIRIYTPGEKDGDVDEYSLSLDARIDLDEYVVYIPEYNIFITTIGTDILHNLSKDRDLFRVERTNALLQLDIFANDHVRPDQPIYVNLHGHTYRTRVLQSPRRSGAVYVFEKGKPELHTTLDDSLLSRSFVHTFSGSISASKTTLIIDHDKIRFDEACEEYGVNDASMGEAATEVISDLSQQIRDSELTRRQLSDTIDNLKYDIKVLNDEINQHKINNKAKADAEKLKQERIKTEKAKNDNNTSFWTNGMKLAIAGVTLGVASISAYLKLSAEATKATATTASNLNNTAGATSTTGIVGIGILGAIYAANTKTGKKVIKKAKEVCRNTVTKILSTIGRAFNGLFKTKARNACKPSIVMLT